MSEVIARPQRAVGHGRKYDCDFTFFEQIDTEAKAYWLGFIAADGCIQDDRTWVIGLASADKAHLEKIREPLKTTSPVREYYRETLIKHPKRGDYIRKQFVIRFQITSRKMVADLVRLGITKRKTFTLEYPSFSLVPKHLQHHFVRGYFDGDGCICSTLDKRSDNLIWRFEIISSQQFCAKMWGTFLHTHMNSVPHFVPHPDSEGITKFTVLRLDDIRSIRDGLYKDATIFLERKKAIFDTVEAKQDEQRDVRNAILAMMRESGDDHSFTEMTQRFPDVGTGTVWLAFRRLIDNGQIRFSKGGRGRQKFYTYDYPDQENDPFRFES